MFKPADNYEDLKRQFFALKKLCESKINQCSIYAKKLAEYDRESIVAGSESLNSEREMNAQLTSELEKANERIAELYSLLREISIDYECDIRHKYSGLIDVPSERPITRRAFNSDMEIIGRVNQQLRKEKENG